jgi:voltage-gated potassium channel
MNLAITRVIRGAVWRRGGLAQFVNKHERTWDLAMAALTIVYVALAFTEDSPVGPQEIAVLTLGGVFLIEFGARYYDALDRRQYLRSHWLDLITAVPLPGIPGLRLLRLLRLLRFAKIGVLLRREFVLHGWEGTQLIWPTLVLFWLASAFALWLVEHDAPKTNIATFSDAMTAAFVTASTLGFSRHAVPVTQDGQIIAATIVFFALGLWGFASSNLTRAWLRAQQDLAETEIKFLGEQVEAMRGEMHRLTQAVRERQLLFPDDHAEEVSGAPDAEPVISGQASTDQN